MEDVSPTRFVSFRFDRLALRTTAAGGFVPSHARRPQGAPLRRFHIQPGLRGNGWQSMGHRNG